MCAIARLKAFGMLIQDFTSDFLIIFFRDSKTKNIDVIWGLARKLADPAAPHSMDEAYADSDTSYNATLLLCLPKKATGTAPDGALWVQTHVSTSICSEENHFGHNRVD